MFFGLHFGQMGLAAVWLALGRTPAVLRVVAVSAVGAGCAAVSSQTLSARLQLITPLNLLVQVTVIAACLRAVRLLMRVPAGTRSEGDSARRGQFTLGSLLGLTTYAAVGMFTVRGPGGDFDFQGQSFASSSPLESFILFVLVVLPTLLVSWCVLLPWSAVRLGVSTLSLVAVWTVLERTGVEGEYLVAVTLLMATQLLIVALPLLVWRARRPRRPTPRATEAPDEAPKVEPPT
jgi:hypothetical protein